MKYNEMTIDTLRKAIANELDTGDQYLLANEPEKINAAIEETLNYLNENTELYVESQTFTSTPCRLGCPIVSIIEIKVDGTEAKQA